MFRLLFTFFSELFMENTIPILNTITSFFPALLVIIGCFMILISGPNMLAYILVAIGVAITIGTFIFKSVETQPTNRIISTDEKRAIKMFEQNCKQVNFIQANSNTGVGAGLSTNGKPIVGAIKSTNEDSYTYKCDDNIEYTLTYDIEEYRKYYKAS